MGQEDAGFRSAAQLMTEIGVAASAKDPVKALSELGIKLSDTTSTAEVAVAVGDVLDKQLSALRQGSDFGEMAGKALVSAVVERIKDRMPSLLAPTPEDVGLALKGVGRANGFGEFARSFFGRLTNECLGYFLTKTLGTKVGEGQRFATNNQMANIHGGDENPLRRSIGHHRGICRRLVFQTQIRGGRHHFPEVHRGFCLVCDAKNAGGTGGAGTKSMNTEHTILCGGLNPAGIPAFGNVMPLNLWPGHGDKTCIKLKIEDLHERICQTTPRQFHDLIEIAAYVYCADQLASRGGKDVDTFGSHWRRRFHYHIPVREPDLWQTPAVSTALRDLLDFLSDDFYDFTFYPVKNAPEIQEYLGLDEKGAKKFDAERVMLFSGGLDSLAGAIEEAVSQRRRVVLMNHRSTEKFCVRHQALLDQLAEKAGPGVLMPMRVRISKAGLDGKDYNQRARSFLYGSVAASVAMMLGLKGIRFYENGVVSLNLPVCAQVVGSRSTRTTHPRVLAAMRHLFSLLAGQDFMVDNPFWKETKGEVIRRIVTAGCETMIKTSRSCAHTWETSNEKPHCGLCSQCI